MTTAAASTSMVSLLTLGIYLIMFYNIDNTLEKITLQVEINAYLEKGIDNYSIKRLQDDTIKFPQVRRVEYITPEQALKMVEQEWLEMEDSVTTPEENPLPPTLKISVSDPRHIKIVADQVGQMDGVEELEYGETILQQLQKVGLIFKIVGYLLTLLMATGALFTIINTIQLTLIARKREIRTMKLVGATTWFIRWPFLLEGIALGTAGAMIAATIVASGYYVTVEIIPESLLVIFPMVPSVIMTQRIFGILLIAGVFMGLAGSYISLNRFLTEREE